MTTSMVSRPDIERVNSLLKMELSAAETYQRALSKLPHSNHRAILQDCADSHEGRARLLAEEVRRLGGIPAQGSGVWGVFAKLVTGGAAVLGERAAISVLEEGEDLEQNSCKRELDGVGPATRELIMERIVPEQNRTHQVMSALKRSGA